MHKLKRIAALALAATMVMGCSITALADDPVTSGGSDGAGSSEGHVDKHVINVELPTIASGSTPFAYTIDPERLVNETDATKYASGTTFTDEAKANGVYFLTGEKAYDTKSQELKVTNKSSADVKLTVEVETEAADADTDIALVDAAPNLDAEGDPELYLELKVGDQTEAISSTEKVSIEETIAGTDGNFQTVVDNGNYVYQPKPGDLTWEEKTIQVSGVVSKSSAEDLTAPTLKVTWKYEDPAATPADTAPTVTGATRVLNQNWDYTMTFTKGQASTLSATGLTAVKWGMTIDDITKDSANITLDNGTVTIAAGNWAGASAGDNRYLKLTVGGQDYIVKITIATP